MVRRAEKGFSLLELVISLIVFSIIVSVWAGYEVQNSKRELARRYIGYFVATEHAIFTLQAHLKSFNPSLSVPLCNGDQFRSLVRTASWRDIYGSLNQNQKNSLLSSYLDPRVDYSKLELILSGNAIVGVRIRDANMRSSLDTRIQELVGSRYSNGIFNFNATNYPYASVNCN